MLGGCAGDQAQSIAGTLISEGLTASQEQQQGLQQALRCDLITLALATGFLTSVPPGLGRSRAAHMTVESRLGADRVPAAGPWK